MGAVSFFKHGQQMRHLSGEIQLNDIMVLEQVHATQVQK